MGEFEVAIGASKPNFSSFLVISSEMLLLFGNYRQ